jgi:hypothetical protein
VAKLNLSRMDVASLIDLRKQIEDVLVSQRAKQVPLHSNLTMLSFLFVAVVVLAPATTALAQQQGGTYSHNGRSFKIEYGHRGGYKRYSGLGCRRDFPVGHMDVDGFVKRRQCQIERSGGR